MKNILKIANIFLLIIALLLSFLIFINKSISISSVNKIYNVLTSYLSIGLKEKEVASSIKFIKIDDDKYYNENHFIYSPFNGTIVDVKDSYIIVKCDNQYYACFEDVFNINVSKYDVVTTNDILATFDTYFIFYFIIDQKRYSYEEVC